MSVFGDINNDGIVSGADVVYLASYIAGLPGYTLTESEPELINITQPISGNVENFKITWKTNKEFHKKFLLGYATTIHKSQGDTIDGKVNIFDIEMIQDWLQDKRALYTALSRAKCLKNIIPSCLK